MTREVNEEWGDYKETMWDKVFFEYIPNVVGVFCVLAILVLIIESIL